MNRAAIAEARKPFGAESVCAVERASAVETFATASVFANVARRVRSAGAVSGRRETTMANEPKGPYRKGDVAFGYIDLDTREAAIANAAWLAGRASRDGLRAVIVDILAHVPSNACIERYAPGLKKSAVGALAEDEKGDENEL